MNDSSTESSISLNLDASSPAGTRRGFSFGGRLQRYDYPAILSRLGKVPDAALAAEIGCPRQRVQELRKSLAIQSHAATRRVQVDRLLGRYTDTELARAFGLTQQAVSYRRRRAGIPRASVKAAHARHRIQDYLDQLTEA